MYKRLLQRRGRRRTPPFSVWRQRRAGRCVKQWRLLPSCRPRPRLGPGRITCGEWVRVAGLFFDREARPGVDGEEWVLGPHVAAALCGRAQSPSRCSWPARIPSPWRSWRAQPDLGRRLHCCSRLHHAAARNGRRSPNPGPVGWCPALAPCADLAGRCLLLVTPTTRPDVRLLVICKLFLF